MINSWVWLTFLSAIFESAVHLLSKKNVSAAGEYLVPASMCTIAGIFTYLLSFKFGFPTVGVNFYTFAILVSILGSAGMVCFMQGLKLSEVSYAVLLLSFTPVLSALWSWVLLGERVSLMGFLGVIIILIGTYILELPKAAQGILTPIKVIFNDIGARYVFAAAVAWSFTSILDKVGVSYSSPLMWTCVVALMMGPMLIVFGLYNGKIDYNLIRTAPWGMLVLLGISYALAIVFLMLAFSSANISYVLSLKRFSILLTVVMGSIFFNESRLRERLSAGFVMIVGGIVIIFYS